MQAAESLPIHIASMMGLMQSLLAKFGGDIREGDIFVANDPHVAGGTHLPDINMAMPVFDRAKLAGGQVIAGPAVVEQLDATTPVYPGDRATVDAAGNIIIEVRT